MSEDLIKRSDAAEVVYKALKTPPLKGVLTDTMSLAIALVRDIPSADRPQGEWILLEPRYAIEQKVYWNEEQRLADTKGNGAEEIRKCSCCGYTKQFFGYMKDKAFKLWNFCPNCGARMVSESDA